MDYQEWFNKYKPHMDEHDPTLLKFYEPREQTDIAALTSADPGTIWTLTQGDDNSLLIQPGYHFVNRLNYIITSVPYGKDDDKIDLTVEYG